jgi:hypothetical protein
MFMAESRSSHVSDSQTSALISKPAAPTQETSESAHALDLANLISDTHLGRRTRAACCEHTASGHPAPAAQLAQGICGASCNSLVGGRVAFLHEILSY